MSRPTTLALLLLAGVMITPVHAAEPSGEAENLCTDVGGMDAPCVNDVSCASNLYATTCAMFGDGTRRCAVPCDDGTPLNPTPGACSAGEICAKQWLPGATRSGFVCLPVPFRMDLALLDQCIRHYLEGTAPVFSESECSLRANLNKLLDQDGDLDFDIFDVDLCVLAFLEQPDCLADERGARPETCCDPNVSLDCDPGDLPECTADEDCGPGLYCSAEIETCQRDCGIIASREVEVASLERECTGALQACDLSRGRCVDVDVTLRTCQVDQECPAGAYCLLGRCAPRCNRSTDCPSGDWYCTTTNRCRALPPPAGIDSFVFDPANYVIRFARESLKLDDIQTEESSTLAILDLITKRQVIGNPAVSFGYRMEVEYGRKQDRQCLLPFVDCTIKAQRPEGETEDQCRARQDECYVDADEEWIRPASPFGTLNASAAPTIRIALEAAVAEQLSPGVYPATVRLIFDNGSTDSIPVTYVKRSPSGTYAGRLTVYWGTPDNALNGARPLTFSMDLSVDETVTKQWDTLLSENNLKINDGHSLIDKTEGFLVNGEIDGTSALMFSNPAARDPKKDKIPFVGIYTPSSKRLRMIGVIDIEADFCVDEDGADCSSQSSEAGFAPGFDESRLQVRNPFKRKIRRRIELIGPFEPAIGRYHGMYREFIAGLAPKEFTLEGGFILDQLVSDDTRIAHDQPILPDGIPKDVAFPVNPNPQVGAPCKPGVDKDNEGRHFASKTQFASYLNQAVRGVTTIFPDLISFRQLIQDSLDSLDDSTATGAQDHLNIYDYLSAWIVPCDADDPSPPPACIDEDKLRCGLAYYQQAILNDWVKLSAVEGTEALPVVGEQDLFCLETLPTTGCPAEGSASPDLFALQEHNRFWRDLAQARKFQGDRARSDAFLVLFRNEINPFVQGTALSYKAQRLREAVRAYDRAATLFTAPAAAAVLFRWPVRAFKQMGYDWLAIMQTIANDRMGAIAELVDLKRRVFSGANDASGNVDDKDYVFAHQMMQMEYLLQVYLLFMQATWQGDAFGYLGGAVEALDLGQQVLMQLNPSRNAIGVIGGQVFFENPDPEMNNWQRYRAILEGEAGDGGLIGQARDDVLEAVDELKGALSDVDTLEEKLNESRITLEETLDELCGDPDPAGDSVPLKDACQALLKQFQDADDWIAYRDCTFDPAKPEQTCAHVSLECDDLGQNTLTGNDDCNHLVKAFEGATDDIVGAQPGVDEDKLIAACHAALASTEYAVEATWFCELIWSRSSIMSACGDFAELAGDIADEECAKFGDYPHAGEGPLDDRCRDMLSSYDDVLKICEAVRPAIEQVQNGAANGPICRLNTPETSIRMNDKSVPCVGGAMGEVLAEQALVELQRRQVVRRLGTLKLRLLTNWERQAQTLLIYDDEKYFERATRITTQVLEFTEFLADALTDKSEKVAAATDCVIIAGLAFGTDCPQKVVKSFAVVAIGVIGTIAKIGFDATKRILDELLFELSNWAERETGNIEGSYELFEIVTEVNGLVDEFAVLTQEAFNLHLAQQNVQYQAQRAVDRYQDQVSFVAEHLIGRESGNLLRGEAIARDASESFRQLLSYTYRMTMAFAHNYNLTAGDMSAIVNESLALVTIDDVADFVGKLSDRERDYCGLESIDCDAGTNVEVLRYSVRDQLFPHLRDVVDAQTGKVLTAGQQFHNTITAPPYLKRRIRGTLPADQVELVIPLPLTLMENAKNGPKWLIDPVSCNHLLDARNPNEPQGAGNGSVAMNVIGRNLGDGAEVIRYELIRGATDYIRACHPESVQTEPGTLPIQEFPIKTFIIGYAPQSTAAQQDAPPSYVTRSASFSACINQPESAGNISDADCWRYFARDRSLGSLDWKLILPLRIGSGDTDNAWITGEGLPEADAPLIEDLVLYFRYRTRPIEQL